MISFSGLATGIDTDSLINGLVKAERTPITRLTQQQQQLTARAAKYGTLRTKLDALATAAAALDTRDEALVSKASSSDDSVLRASATGGASPGRFDVRVNRLASAARMYADPVAARDQAGLFGSGTLEIQVGSGAPVSIAVSASSTLDSVIADIQSSGADVSAGVLYDGSSFRLQIVGNQTGAANAVTLTETGTTFGFGTPGNLVQQAEDAEVVIDGFTITSATNTITAAIPGVTLDLAGTSAVGTTQRVEVKRDPASLESKVKAFVDAYNAVSTFVQSESTYVGVTKGADSLMGDTTLRTVQSALRRVVGGEVTGAGATLSTLASLGISTQRDGTLSLDTTKLGAAVSSDPNAVALIFARDGDGIMKSLKTALDPYTDRLEGVLGERMGAIESRKRALQGQIDRMELRVSAYEDRLRAQFTSLETLVSGLNAQSSQMMAMLDQMTRSTSSSK